MLSSRTAAALVAISLSMPAGVARAQTPTPLPQFDRVLLLETTAETSANASIGARIGHRCPRRDRVQQPCAPVRLRSAVNLRVKGGG